MSTYEVLVEVRSGKDFANKKMVEKPAIYVKVHVDELSEKTDEIADLEHPVWNHKFKFVVDHLPKAITFEVKDDRTLLPNAKLGHFDIDVDSLGYGGDKALKVIDGEVTLIDANQGTLNVCAIIQPLGWEKRHKHMKKVSDKSNVANQSNVAVDDDADADAKADAANANANANVNANVNTNANGDANVKGNMNGSQWLITVVEAFDFKKKICLVNQILM